MPSFYNSFPKLVYDIDGSKSGSYDVVTNIFVRLGILKSVQEMTSSYYPYLIQEGDTPEMVADKYYGDPTYHWIVLMMNNIVDPFYDWPLDYTDFASYINNKYGSLAAAQVLIVRYEKQIARLDSSSGVTTTSKMVIDAITYTAMATTAFNTYNLSNNTTVSETITKNTVTAWTDELAKNEAKRSIKLLKKEYLGIIKGNFDTIIGGVQSISPSIITPRIV